MEALTLEELWNTNRWGQSGRNRSMELQQRKANDDSVFDWICKKEGEEERRLRRAVNRGDLKKVERYIEKGYSVRPSDTSLSLLECASRRRDPGFLTALLRNYSFDNTEDCLEDVRWALSVACEHRRPKNAKILLDMQGGMTESNGCLITAVYGGKLECIHVIWSYKEHIPLREKQGALVLAVREHRLRCAKFLLEEGISDDPDVFWWKGDWDRENEDSPMFRGVRAGDLCMMKLLSAYGAPRTRIRGDVVQHVRETTCKTKILEWLDATETWTRLHYVEQLTEQHARKLLRGSADVFAQDETGVTPVDRAKQVLETKEKEGELAARLILKAAQPWSRETHNLFPEALRVKAVKALFLGYAFQRATTFFLPIDVWRDHVLPHIVARR